MMKLKRHRIGLGCAVAGAALATLYFGWPAKARSTAPEEIAPLVVPAAQVARADLARTVSIPAEFRPYALVELHAKVSGYLEKMNVDFGDRVTAGQLLATIEAPELQDELNNAVAIEQRAEADYTNAHLLYTRLLAVNRAHPNLVAQQEIDTATAKDLTAQAQIAAAAADAGKYRTLVNYTRILAPFDGVITRRYLDPGALVEAGTASSTAQPLLEISDNFRLRLDFPVSVAYVKDIQVGAEVTGQVESLGGRSFRGRITRTTMKVNDDTRTMITELEVTNADLALAPGMYASVAFQVERHPQAVAIPIEAVPPGQAATVYVINSQNEIEERPVTLGLATPTQFEVTSGLRAGELVLTGSRSQVRPGQKVEPKITAALAQR